ncbi:MAG: DUF3611 family protein [Gemmataceae bacterium]
MSETLNDVTTPPADISLARAFSRLGWAGFWGQLVFGSLPVVVIAYYFAFSSSGTVSRSGIPFVEYLTVANLLLLAFTIFWSFRYTRLANRLLDPAKRPDDPTIIRVVWTGVMLCTLSMFVSVVVILIEAANILFFFLKAPQGGIGVIQTTGGETRYFVSSVDMVSLMALLLTLFAELLAQIFSLRLLYRTTRITQDRPGSGPDARPAAGA